MEATFMVLGIFGRNMKQVVSVVMIALSVLFVSAFSVNAQYSRIALVDLQKVILESEKGKEAKRTLTDVLDRLKKDLAARQGELQRMKNAAEQQGSMTLDAKSEKDKQYRRKLQEYQNLSEDYQVELKAKDQEFTGKILKEVKEVIKSTGAKDKYTLIVAKSRPDDSIILFMDPAIAIIDISEEVIRQYNNFTKTQTTSAETAPMQSVPSAVPTDTARTDQTRGLNAQPTISTSKVQKTKPHKAPQKKKKHRRTLHGGSKHGS
jgi:outer membrane protein